MGSISVMSSATDPFNLLAELERRSKERAEGLPAQEEVIQLWNGIGFTLAGCRYVAPMGEVSEILHLPRFTQIPGVHPWMNGIANVRGRLLPIMDLSSFFNVQGSTRSTRDKRVLVVERNDVLSGLIVDSVQGMQYFPVDSYENSSSGIPASMRAFILGQYSKNEEAWTVFSPFLMIEDPSFVDVAQW